MGGAATRTSGSQKTGADRRGGGQYDTDEILGRMRELVIGAARDGPGRRAGPRDLRNAPLKDLTDSPIEADNPKHVRAFYGLPLDQKIVPLVRTLQAVSLGFRTAGSCEGHLDRGDYHYPWVMLRVESPFGKEALKAMTEGFNATSETKWVLRFDSGERGERALLRPEAKSIFSISGDEFRRLQESSEAFARFIYERYVADPAVREELSRLCKMLLLAEARRGSEMEERDLANDRGGPISK